MCTVSFTPCNNGLVFTFSRDERSERHTGNFIISEQLPHKKIFFAQDSKAGGSWFAADSVGNVAMLFNGGFVTHVKKQGYAKSRGIILKEIAAAENMLLFFENVPLDEIEPFSVLLLENNQLYRLTWTGVEKNVLSLDNAAAYIFSSSTLYTEKTQLLRRQWFNKYSQQQSFINSQTIFDFHQTCNSHDKENGLVIERAGGCSTLSISQAVICDGQTVLKHLDLRTGDLHVQSILTHEHETVF